MTATRDRIAALPGAGKIEDVKKAIAELPKKLATEAAAEAAPLITGLATGAWDTRHNVYGDAYPRSLWDGHALTLRKTGDARGEVKFVNTGTLIRCYLGKPYTKYLIGKYRVLPPGNTAASLPVSWRRAIDSAVQGVQL